MKPYRHKSRLRGKPRTKKPKKRILILCQGEETEVNYFKGFRAAHVRALKYSNAKNLIQEAIRKKDFFEKINGKVDETWCVFDRDTFPEKHIEDVIHLAGEKGIKIAFTNRCFELWIILHFQSFDKPTLSAKEYKMIVKDIFKKNNIGPGDYMKSDQDIYFHLEDFIQVAIGNAEKLFKKNKNPLAEPWTSVHLLVKELLKNN